MGKISNPVANTTTPTPAEPGTKRFHDSGTPGAVMGSRPLDEYVDDLTGDLYTKNADNATWTLRTNLKGPPGAASTVAGPRGLQGTQGLPGTAGADGRIALRGGGGFPGQVCYRLGNGDLAPLTPTMDAEYDREIVVIDKDNKAVITGHPANVTGLPGFIGGRDMYVIAPATASSVNLTAVAADGTYPSNVEPTIAQRFFLAGRCITVGTETFFTINPRAYVARSTAAPVVTTMYLDATDMTLDTNAVTAGKLTSFFSSSGQGPFGVIPRLDSNTAAGGTGFQASTLDPTVSAQHYAYGGLHIKTPTGWDAQADGSWMVEWQAGDGNGAGTIDISQPGIVLRAVAPVDAGTPGRALWLHFYNNTMVLQQLTLNFDRTFSTTDIVSVGVDVAVNVIHKALIDLRGTEMKVKLWRATAAVPSAFVLERSSIPITGAGVVGCTTRQDHYRLYRISRAIGIGGTAPLVRP